MQKFRYIKAGKKRYLFSKTSNLQESKLFFKKKHELHYTETVG